MAAYRETRHSALAGGEARTHPDGRTPGRACLLRVGGKKHGFVALAMVALIGFAEVSHAQQLDWLNKNMARNGSTVVELLRAVELAGKSVASYGGELQRLRGNVGLVFLPGILGSALVSKSKGKIWSSGIPDMAKLRLPPELLDPEVVSDIDAVLADGVDTYNLYGDAIKMIRQSAQNAGIRAERIAACGYDWRRDIRAGARDLKRCIESKPELQGIEALVVVAHSMGGLVTWQWHQEFASNGALANGVPVIAIAILGSPLGGSCEIVRMIQMGYAQPTLSDKHTDDSWLKRFWPAMVAMKDRIVNAISSEVTDQIRPVVLTWPGAIELTPPPTDTRDQACAPVPLYPDDATDPRLLSHFSTEFWNQPVGKSLLAGKPLPDSSAEMLPVASAFRSAFKLEPIASPTYLFASEMWDTPNQAKLVPPTYVLDARGTWHTVDGDGRVPYLAAVPRAIQTRAADVRRVYSVHGNLPEDKVFHEEFFGGRLPRVLRGWIATQIMTKATSDPAFLTAYVAAGGRQVHPYDLQGSYERQSETNQRAPIYRLTTDAWNAAIDFNNALCGVTPCLEYRQARDAAEKESARERAALFLATRTSGAPTDDERTFLIAKRGLAMAQNSNWVAAIGDLREAVPALETRRQRLAGKETTNERTLRINAAANLGRALVMRGFCAEAEPYLRRTAAHNSYAADTLQASCYDRDTGKIVKFVR
jgi:hypothetical protein